VYLIFSGEGGKISHVRIVRGEFKNNAVTFMKNPKGKYLFLKF